MFHVVWTRRRPFSLLVGWVGFDSCLRLGSTSAYLPLSVLRVPHASCLQVPFRPVSYLWSLSADENRTNHCSSAHIITFVWTGLWEVRGNKLCGSELELCCFITNRNVRKVVHFQPFLSHRPPDPTTSCCEGLDTHVVIFTGCAFQLF